MVHHPLTDKGIVHVQGGLGEGPGDGRLEELTEPLGR